MTKVFVKMSFLLCGGSSGGRKILDFSASDIALQGQYLGKTDYDGHTAACTLCRAL